MIKRIISKAKNRFGNKKGFSLIELIMCIVIIAILAGLGMTSGAKYVDESKITKAQAEVATLEIAVSQYNIDNPTEKITAIKDTTISDLISKGYLQKAPAYNGTDKCTYSYAQVNGSTEKHVILSGCSFFGDTYSYISVYGNGKKSS